MNLFKKNPVTLNQTKPKDYPLKGYIPEISSKVDEVIEKSKTAIKDKEYIFEWPYEGNQVLLAGEFNNWIAQPMKREGSKWILNLKLTSGKSYQYKFIVDGIWKYDGLKNTEHDNIGNINNIVTI